MLQTKGTCVSSFKDILSVITKSDHWWEHIMGHPVLHLRWRVIFIILDRGMIRNLLADPYIIKLYNATLSMNWVLMVWYIWLEFSFSFPIQIWMYSINSCYKNMFPTLNLTRPKMPFGGENSLTYLCNIYESELGSREVGVHTFFITNIMKHIRICILTGNE